MYISIRYSHTCLFLNPIWLFWLRFRGNALILFWQQDYRDRCNDVRREDGLNPEPVTTSSGDFFVVFILVIQHWTPLVIVKDRYSHLSYPNIYKITNLWTFWLNWTKLQENNDRTKHPWCKNSCDFTRL